MKLLYFFQFEISSSTYDFVVFFIFPMKALRPKWVCDHNLCVRPVPFGPPMMSNFEHFLTYSDGILGDYINLKTLHIVYSIFL